MAYSSTDLSNVEDAILDLSTGSRVVEIEVGGKRIKYQAASLATLRELRDMIRQDLAGSTSFVNKVRFDNAK